MIVFDLKCSQSHVFEAWFSNSEAFEKQAAAGQIECPVCGDVHITKALMAPNIPAKGNQKSEQPAPETFAEHVAAEEEMVPANMSVPVSANIPEQAEVTGDDVKRAIEYMHDTMAKYRKYVEANCENVGDNFAEEARKIHYGEAENRGIFGETTIEESQELLDEGIDIIPLPGGGKLSS